MKYLKRYKILEKSDLVLDIEDILLELKDAGFDISITSRFIRIGKDKPFKYAQVSEDIERLRTFLGENFIKIEAICKSKGFITLYPTLHSNYEMNREITHDLTNLAPESKIISYLDIKRIKILYFL